jgi:hypothetical protein
MTALLTKPSQPAGFFVREQVALTHVKQTTIMGFGWNLELSNAFDCVSQKENIYPKHSEQKNNRGVNWAFY